jgi:hypothetical protein
MNYDNEAIVRNACHTAEGNVLDIPGWIDSFTEDGVFNNVTGEESYRGEHLKDVVSRRASKRRRNRLWTNVSRRSPRTSRGQCHGRCRRH